MAALTLTNSSTDLSGVKNLNVYVRGDSDVGTGSTLTMIRNNNGISMGSDTSYSGILNRGATFDYDLDISLAEDGRSVIARVNDNNGPTDDTETVTKSEIASVEVVNSSSDNVATNFNNTFSAKLEEEQEEENNSGDHAQNVQNVNEIHGFEIFGNIGVGSLKTSTSGGGHVKSHTTNFDLGLARTYEGQRGKWIVAPVFEYGKGDYDAYLSTGIKGYGNTKYTAGGLITRRINNNGNYIELSARFGRTKNDFASNDFQNSSGQKIRATYHSSAPVFAGHIRIGRAMRLNRNNLLDVYGIYAYTRQGGSSANLSTGEPYKFSSVSSSRLKLGYRLTTRTSRISSIYTGLAYQYERTSDTNTTAIDAEGVSWNLPSSGAKGSSGMIELGWLIRPNKNNPWVVDINATGWVGHQKGLTAMAKIKKSF